MKTVKITLKIDKTDIKGQYTGEITLKSIENKEVYFKYHWDVPIHNLRDMNVELANKKEYFNIDGSTFLIYFNKLTNRQQKIFSLMVLIMPSDLNHIKIPKNKERFTILKEVEDDIYEIIFKK